MTTTVTAPVWTPWTSYYDSAGQGPAMVAHVAGDGLSVQFLLDRFTLSVQGDQDAPFAGAAGLSGALSVDVPPDFNLLGFLLVVNGHVEKTVKSQAVVTCSIGHGTQSQSWQLGIPAGDGDLVAGSRLQPGVLHQRLQPRHGRGAALPAAPALPRHREHAGPPPDRRRSHRHQRHRLHRHPGRVIDRRASRAGCQTCYLAEQGIGFCDSPMPKQAMDDRGGPSTVGSAGVAGTAPMATLDLRSPSARTCYIPSGIANEKLSRVVSDM